MNTFNDDVTLIKREQKGFDDYGNPKIEVTRTNLMCNVRSIYRSEFYQASTADYKPSIQITIHDFEYNNEQEVEYKGKTLWVIRAYKDYELIELTLGEKLGGM